jgi:capsular polysaccharide transport system permease protein
VTILAFTPTTLAAGYYGLIATDQYVSESRFVVRSAARPEISGLLSGLAQLGIGPAQDDASAVQDFLTSRDATRQLREALPVDQIYGDEDADFLARFPSVIYGRTEEEFFKYFQHMISVGSHNGIAILRVRAFRAEEALHVSQALLGMGEQLVNRMNVRIQRDAIAASQKELELSQRRLVQAQIELASFRNRELMIDPARNAATLSELIGKMSSDLAETRAQVTTMLKSSPSSPQLTSLRHRESSLAQEVAVERSRIAGSSDGLAERIATYDRLNLEREFANRMMTSAETELARARSEALRQQLYLERIVEPGAADYPTEPHRLASIITVFAANLIGFFLLWLVFTGVREHRAGRT